MQLRPPRAALPRSGFGGAFRWENERKKKGRGKEGKVIEERETKGKKAEYDREGMVKESNLSW